MLVLLGLSGCSVGSETADASAGTTADSGQSGTGQNLSPQGHRKPVPALAGTTLAGKHADLASLRGRVTVVNFWASWCPPCRAETPVLVKAAQDNPTVAFLGVDEKESASAAQAFVRSFAVPYPSIVDRLGTLTARWPSIPALPVTFVVDADGDIAARFAGGVTSDSLGAVLDSLATEK
ncbi:TlpA family protein disulfide reductase [Frankia sp. AgKG'84/4]|uniref:TlpA family protein disulfide reductase n=1 Tax=Frankia sp. AgKG'84/4 TaxID=573490 RepID=UPI00200CB483|nr:TlpA disulfide reductase family protein [Frankia sp. AgKG'84/4]MCL9794489.1 TlpA family protein disulfide reductase [Frankia sp. AgKG'84/4]